MQEEEKKIHIILLLKVIRTFIIKFGKGKALTNTSHLSHFPTLGPPVWSVCLTKLVFVCVSPHLRQHVILPPSGHAEGEQVIDGGGILQAALTGFSLVWKTTDHRISAGLDGQRGRARKRGKEEGRGGGRQIRMGKAVIWMTSAERSPLKCQNIMF